MMIKNMLKGLVFVIFCAITALSSEGQCMDQDEKSAMIPKGRTMVANLNKPGPEVWKDQNGVPAPASVRQAADNLWDTVKIEGEVAFKGGWGMKEVTSQYSLTRAVLCCLTCGFSECCCCDNCPRNVINENNGEFCNTLLGEGRFTSIEHEQKQTIMYKVFANFKETVNNCVLNPEQYQGDAHICGDIESWVRDNCQSKKGDGSYAVHSGRRDLSHVAKDTLRFVNEHGGWNTKADQPLILKTEIRGNVLHVGF